MPAYQIASLVAEGFDTFYAEFMRHTRAARRLFDAAQWARLHEQSQARIDLYPMHVARTLASIAPITSRYPGDRALWKSAHVHYADLVADRPDVEVAETFFNAITRKIFHTVGVHPDVEFLGERLPQRLPDDPEPRQRLAPTADLTALFQAVLGVPRPPLRWHDVRTDARWLAERFSAAYPELAGGAFDVVEVLPSLFFRVREGYIVGRMVAGARVIPLVIALRPGEHGTTVDGAIFTRAEADDVFSSTRPYLFVDLRRPSDTVTFLGSFLDRTRSELYISVAHHRHGKTTMYREFVDHMANSDDPFVIAPGVRGLVMVVFTMGSYRNVFKLIRDRPDKPGLTAERVRAAYRFVFRGQRAGRLADTQEFEHLAFERRRFDPACLRELQKAAPSQIEIRGDEVVVHHLYIEEKMTPLDIHLRTADQDTAAAGIVDYGSAIKELAAHDIFAGDLLWKNFGVGRAGRLVLYDYDEVRSVSSCRFRKVPAPQSWEDELAAGPYWAVGEDDVLPEEWAPFVVPAQPAAVRDAFLHAHADLLHPDWWCTLQRDLALGRLRVQVPYVQRNRG